MARAPAPGASHGARLLDGGGRLQLVPEAVGHLPQFRQMANFTYGTNKEVIKSLSPDLLRLLGFKPWGGYGAIGDPSAENILEEQLVGELSDA